MRRQTNHKNRTERPGAWLRAGFRNTHGSFAAIACGALLTASAATPAKAPFSGMYVFGDSLSDTGNFYLATGVPPFPYWEGRVSDGPVWVEYLAAELRIPTDRADQLAWLGSKTGDTNYRDIPELGLYFPGFEQQIDAFLADVGEEGADPDALYTVWVGANDFFDWLVKQDQTPGELVMTGVANTARGIADLAAAGARHFIVGNVPDLGMTPDGQALGPVVAGALSQMSSLYNTALEEQLAELEASLGIIITRLDGYGIIHQIAANPELFGMTNVTDPAIASYPVSDPSEYLFWDGVHPTTAAHEWIADFACAGLLQTYAPPKARGRGPKSPRALNGLVQAATRRK